MDSETEHRSKGDLPDDLKSLYSVASESLRSILLQDESWLSEDNDVALRLEDILLWLWGWAHDLGGNSALEQIQNNWRAERVESLRTLLAEICDHVVMLQECSNQKFPVSKRYDTPLSVVDFLKL